jgi:predicted transcriptional regulator of viral defense system
MKLMDDLSTYASPKARLTRMIKSGEVIKIRRGLYVKSGDCEISVSGMAAAIYGPSYISFESALAFYGMIPEKVAAVTSAVYKKNKNKEYHTPFGSFYYYYLPEKVYPYELLRLEEYGQGYLIASPAKAVCDTLYKSKGIETEYDLETWLITDMRIDRERLRTLDIAVVKYIAPLYKKRSVDMFAGWLSKREAK